MPYRTRCTAARSVRFSANCNTVTSASWPGDQPGLPLAPNASANSVSENNSPSSSRTRIANGYGPRAATARATCAVSSGSFGHSIGRIDIPHPTRDRNAKNGRFCPDQRAARPAGHGISQQDR